MKILRYIMIILLVAGCGKTHCPGYIEEYNNWIPYKQGDKLSFTDGKDTFNLKVDTAYRSTNYTQSSWPIDQACQAQADVNISGDTILPKISESCIVEIIGQTEKYYRISFYCHENSFFSFDIKDLEKPTGLLTNYDNGYSEYLNVLKLEIDTLTIPQQIYLVYFAESIGIVQFLDRFNHKTWSLIRN
jgi:hypothetical protein